MTNYHAIATVTAALRNMLFDNLHVHPFEGIKITAKPPDVLEHDGPEMRLNLFLYHVTQNTGYQSFDLPTRNAMGELVKTPVLALNLYYLLTAYTADADELEDIQPQQILAKAMVALHENPLITREKIHQARLDNPKIPHTDTGDNLDDQVEVVKVSLFSQSLEEMIKLWSSFFQTHYRLSMAYIVTVVLLDSRKETKAGPPVQERKLYVLPIRRPMIDRIEPQIVERTSDAKIKLIGRNLIADSVKVLFDTSSVKPKPADLSDTEITVGIPNELTAGIKQVQIVHPLMAGDPAVEHENWNVSNVAAFVLAPLITGKSPTTPIRVGESITLAVEPGVVDKQKVQVFLGNHMFDIKLPPSATVVKTLPPILIPADFPVTGPIESFLLRVRSDGVDSFVRLDANRSSATFNKYIPFVEIMK